MSGMKKDAKVTVGIDGVDQVVSGSRRIKDEVSSIGGAVGSAFRRAGSAISDELRSIGSDVIRTATALSTISFAEAIRWHHHGPSFRLDREARNARSADLSNCGSESVISCHAAFSSTKMCLSGRSPGSLSSRPAGISHHSAAGSGSGTGDPQRRQNDARYRGGVSTSGAS
jgi:hypothetical protein